MAGTFGASVVIDRPIDDVFAFLVDGENDPKFSARVQIMEKATDGPPGVGTVLAPLELRSARRTSPTRSSGR